VLDDFDAGIGRAHEMVTRVASQADAAAVKSDVTLQALCDRLSAERGVKADTSMMSRFFRKIGGRLKRRSSRANRIAGT
jgi:transposase